jgi:hypothetical protein
MTRWSSRALFPVRFFLHYGVMERTHTAQAIAIERVSNVYIPYIFQDNCKYSATEHHQHATLRLQRHGQIVHKKLPVLNL